MATHDQNELSSAAPEDDTAPLQPQLQCKCADAAPFHEATRLAQLLLAPGEVLSDRFVVQERAGVGGMGVVHRGLDISRNGPVAIKMMLGLDGSDAQRFARESAILSALVHPGIVRYIAQGTTRSGAPFLVMEWLEGEVLAERLMRGRLSVQESLNVLRQASEATAVAHAQGVVHRDLKPSNLFLVEGDADQLKVLDFGVARVGGHSHKLTLSNDVLGTVGYMAPEQAMGAPDLDAGADVFALGCVLYECLTGRPAFTGPTAVAVLAKVLYDDPPRASSLLPELDPAIDRLLSHMLAKDPKTRLRDAAAILRALQIPAELKSHASTETFTLSAKEERIVSVILAADSKNETAMSLHEIGRVRELLSGFGAETTALYGGALLIVLACPGTATDQARRAVECALLLRRTRPQLRCAIATGRVEVSGDIPVGAAIDRAAMRLSEDSSGIALDELTTVLVDPVFEVVRLESGPMLGGRRAEFEATRLLMGKPTPFVGRRRELGLLELTLRECIEESLARAVLVTGPPGQGKSRLRQEFVERLQAPDRPRIVLVRADAVGAESALALVRLLVRQALGLRENDPMEQQQAAVQRMVNEHAQLSEFLSEMIGLPSSEPTSRQLTAARADVQGMSAWLRRSFVEWFSLECERGPLLLIIEDLHWADAASISYLGEALAAASNRPFMLLALARPESHLKFPKLWSRAEPLELRLGQLPLRASTEFANAVLGDQVSPDAIAAVVERAQGNAFYLEELLRCAAEGGDPRPPETVLALLEYRLARLEPAARRVVRAASVFGETFWSGGLATLLGNEPSTEELDNLLSCLREQELFDVAAHSRFVGEDAYRFRHDLMREAAYAMLTSADRAGGHALAGAWLEHNGERDAAILAQHFEWGGERARALPWMIRSARLAVVAGNTQSALQLVERALQYEPDDNQRGRLLIIRMEASLTRPEWSVAEKASVAAMALIPPATPAWYSAVGGALFAATFTGNVGVVTKTVAAILQAPPPVVSSGSYGRSIFLASQGLAAVDKLDVVATLIERAETLAADPAHAVPAFEMWLHCARAVLRQRLGNLGGVLESTASASALADQIDSVLGRAMSAQYALKVLSETGHLARTLEAGRAAAVLCEPMHLTALRNQITLYVGCAYADHVATMADAQSLEALLLPLLDHRDFRVVPAVHGIVSSGLLQAGDVNAAKSHAELALALARFPSQEADALGTMAMVDLELGQPKQALARGERGMTLIATGSNMHTRSTLLLVRALALRATGRDDEAREVARNARERLLRLATTLEESELREAFLSRPPHRRTLRLAEELLS